MPRYRLELSAHAERMLLRMAKREPAMARRVATALDALQDDPTQGKALKGELRGRYSHRVGTYRIVYLIRHRVLLVLVIDIGHRRDIYR